MPQFPGLPRVGPQATRQAQAIPYQPGKLVLDTGTVIEQTIDWDDAFYDTVEFVPASNLLPVGVQHCFANPSVSNKSTQHTNLSEPRKIPSRYLFKIFRIGVHVRQMAGGIVPDPRDVVALYETAYMTFKINTNQVTVGPLLRYQSGYGVVGNSTANDFSTITLGVASQASAPRLKKQHDISERDQLFADLTIDTNGWLAGTGANVIPPMYQASILATVFLDGAVSRPLGT